MDIKTQKSDINNLEDIKIFVNSFYDKVRTDDVLATIFNDVIKDKWPQHLEKMYRFWQTVLLEEHTYFGSPFLPHAKLPVNAAHFERWVKLLAKLLTCYLKEKKQTVPNGRAIEWQPCSCRKLNITETILQYH